MMQNALIELTSEIVSAHVSNNTVTTEKLPQLITAIYDSLSLLGKESEPVEEERRPAVSIRASVKPDVITCLECGARQKTLKRHLGVQHNLSPDEYRARWKLPPDYPLVSADYAAKRAELAVQIGLGSKGGRKKVDSPTSGKAAASKSEQAKAPQPTAAQPEVAQPKRGKAAKAANAAPAPNAGRRASIKGDTAPN